MWYIVQLLEAYNSKTHSAKCWEVAEWQGISFIAIETEKW